MKTIYVTHSVVKEQVTCLVVADEQDLVAQLASIESSFKQTPFVAKPQRDKTGKPLMHQMSSDWDNFKST